MQYFQQTHVQVLYSCNTPASANWMLLYSRAGRIIWIEKTLGNLCCYLFSKSKMCAHVQKKSSVVWKIKDFFNFILILYLQEQILKGRRIILQQVCRVSGDETHPEQTSVVMRVFFLDHLMKTKIAMWGREVSLKVSFTFNQALV